jgi:hypothetical protein
MTTMKKGLSPEENHQRQLLHQRVYRQGRYLQRDEKSLAITEALKSLKLVKGTTV